jgi:hypothetical protein
MEKIQRERTAAGQDGAPGGMGVEELGDGVAGMFGVWDGAGGVPFGGCAFV